MPHMIGGTMRAGNTVYGNFVSLLDVELYPVKGACDGLMSAWNMAEIAFNPFSVCGNAKFESPGAVIGDVGGVVGVSGCCEAGDDELNVRELCW